MKTMRLMLMTMIASLSMAATSPIFAETGSKNIPGSYQLNIETPEGERTGVMKILNQQGTYNITLEEEGTSNNWKCTNVKIEGNKVAFYFYAEGYDVNMNLKIEDDEVSGTMMWEYQVEGKRIKKGKV